MNEEKKPEIQPQNDANALMQHVVQNMLPDDLKKNFDVEKKPDDIATVIAENLDPKFVQKPIRTYERDLAEALAKKQGLAVPIASVGNSKKEEVKKIVLPKPETKPENKLSGSPQPPLQRVVQAIMPSDLMNTPGELTKYPINKINSQQQTIRTYESDIAENFSKQQTSIASIAIAENKRKEKISRKEEVGKVGGGYAKQILFGLLGIIFIGGGIAGGYYLYKQSAFAKPYVAPKIIAIPGIIPSDRQIPLILSDTVTGDQLMSLLHSELAKESASPEKILEFDLSETSTNTATNKKSAPAPISASSFVDQANINMPDIIKRSITDRWMLGSYIEDDGQKTMFIALSTDFFQNVFAGMLSWENTMPDDLSALFNYQQKIQGVFSDKVIRNRDVREFRDTNGNLILLYSFIDKQTLIVTTTESAFAGEVDRVEKQTYVR